MVQLGTQNSIVGVVEMPLAELENLSTGSKERSSSLLMRTMNRTNTVSLVIFANRPADEMTTAARNLKSFVDAFKVSMFDVLAADGSFWEQRREIAPKAEGTFFNRHQGAADGSPLPADQVRAVIDRVSLR